MVKLGFEAKKALSPTEVSDGRVKVVTLTPFILKLGPAVARTGKVNVAKFGSDI